jgi:hypothetical protein
MQKSHHVYLLNNLHSTPPRPTIFNLQSHAHVKRRRGVRLGIEISNPIPDPVPSPLILLAAANLVTSLTRGKGRLPSGGGWLAGACSAGGVAESSGRPRARADAGAARRHRRREEAQGLAALRRGRWRRRRGQRGRRCIFVGPLPLPRSGPGRGHRPAPLQEGLWPRGGPPVPAAQGEGGLRWCCPPGCQSAVARARFCALNSEQINQVFF